MRYKIRATGNGGSLRVIGTTEDVCDAIVMAILHGCQGATAIATIWDEKKEVELAKISQSCVEIKYGPSESLAEEVVEHVSQLAMISSRVLSKFAVCFMYGREK